MTQTHAHTLARTPARITHSHNSSLHNMHCWGNLRSLYLYYTYIYIFITNIFSATIYLYLDSLTLYCTFRSLTLFSCVIFLSEIVNRGEWWTKNRDENYTKNKKKDNHARTHAYVLTRQVYMRTQARLGGSNEKIPRKLTFLGSGVRYFHASRACSCRVRARAPLPHWRWQRAFRADVGHLCKEDVYMRKRSERARNDNSPAREWVKMQKRTNYKEKENEERNKNTERKTKPCLDRRYIIVLVCYADLLSVAPCTILSDEVWRLWGLAVCERGEKKVRKNDDKK